MDGFKAFQLEFHVPFPTLRCTHGATSLDGISNGGKAWLDVGFLGVKCDEDQPNEPCSWTLHEANVSVVVCGWDHWRWVGWAFSNIVSDPTSRDEEAPEVAEDHFATDGSGPEDVRFVDSNDPIWEPREYWLRIVNIRMSMIHKEWKWLVCNVEQCIEAWVSLWLIHEGDVSLTHCRFMTTTSSSLMGSKTAIPRKESSIG